MSRQIGSTDSVLLSIYIFVNELFVYKYACRVFTSPLMPCLIYMAIAIAMIFLLFRNYSIEIPQSTLKTAYIALVVICAIALAVLMRQFDPAQIKVARYDALHEWISRLLGGEFPYSSPVKPSGLPFLFALALPFYIAGDLGYFQIFGFLLFSAIVYYRFSGDAKMMYRPIIPLIMSPVFLFEVAARSELITNMIIIIAYLVLVEYSLNSKKRISPIILGIGAGLLLSTRAIAVLILAPCLIYYFKRGSEGRALFIVSMILGFAVTLLPFVLWSPKSFTANNPLLIQSSYSPVWLNVLALTASVLTGLFSKTMRAVYTSVSLILFLAVFVPFLIKVSYIGWYSALVESGFDISYFCFSIPFLPIASNLRLKDPEIAIN